MTLRRLFSIWGTLQNPNRHSLDTKMILIWVVFLRVRFLCARLFACRVLSLAIFEIQINGKCFHLLLLYINDSILEWCVGRYSLRYTHDSLNTTDPHCHRVGWIQLKMKILRLVFFCVRARGEFVPLIIWFSRIIRWKWWKRFYWLSNFIASILIHSLARLFYDFFLFVIQIEPKKHDQLNGRVIYTFEKVLWMKKKAELFSLSSHWT